MIWLRDLYKSFIKSKALLYTTDMCGDSYLKCGSVADVYATVDFGSWDNDGKYFNFLLHRNKMITIFLIFFLFIYFNLSLSMFSKHETNSKRRTAS